jgi:hypothetical protein
MKAEIDDLQKEDSNSCSKLIFDNKLKNVIILYPKLHQSIVRKYSESKDKINYNKSIKLISKLLRAGCDKYSLPESNQ